MRCIFALVVAQIVEPLFHKRADIVIERRGIAKRVYIARPAQALVALVRGEFYTDNLRGAKATDSFTVKGARTVRPEFTFHGFRYLKITGGAIPTENVTALVMHTDMARTGSVA